MTDEKVLLTVYVPGVKKWVARVVERDGDRVWRSWLAVEGAGSRDRPMWRGSTVSAVREIELPIDHPDAGWALVPGLWNVRFPMDDVRSHLGRGDRKMVHQIEHDAE